MPAKQSRKTVRSNNNQWLVNLSQRRSWFADEPPVVPVATVPATTPITETPPDKNGGDKGIAQDTVNKLVGDARKEGRASALAELLKELGFEKADDLKAIVKAKKEADEAALSEVDKAQKRAEAAEKKAADAEAAREALVKERLLDKRNDAIKTALLTARANAKEVGKVMLLLNGEHPDKVAAVLKDDGTINEAALKTLVETARTENKSYFGGSGPGSPSLSDGTNSQPGDDQKRRAAVNLQRILKG